MPVSFPVRSESGALVDTDHYSLAEIAERLHMSETTARKLAAADDWPHFKVANRVWVSESDFAAILDGMRHGGDAPAVPEANGAPTLGEPLPADAWDDEAGPSDGDPGGVR